MSLQESGEMYLETIYVLSKEMPYVRSVDVCEYMGYSKPSVSRAMGLLRQGGYIDVDKSGMITLTEQGLSVAIKTYERHTLLTELFVSIGVDRATASADACKIEHVISDETFEALKNYSFNERKAE